MPLVARSRLRTPDQIKGKAITGDKGIAVFTVPGLDLDALRRNGAAIGEWPEAADGEISAFMRLLLSADPAVRDDFAKLGEIKLTDLRKANDDQIAAAERIVWAIKGLFFDLTTTGPAGLQERLREGLGGKTATVNAPELLAGLPQDLVNAAQQAWFPMLAKEVSLHRSGAAVPMPGPAAGGTTDSGAQAAPASNPLRPRRHPRRRIAGGCGRRGEARGETGNGAGGNQPRRYSRGRVAGGDRRRRETEFRFRGRAAGAKP